MTWYDILGPVLLFAIMGSYATICLLGLVALMVTYAWRRWVLHYPPEAWYPMSNNEPYDTW